MKRYKKGDKVRITDIGYQSAHFEARQNLIGRTCVIFADETDFIFPVQKGYRCLRIQGVYKDEPFATKHFSCAIKVRKVK